MDTSLSSIFDLYTFPTGRRIFALAQVRKAALAAGETDLAASALACLDYDEALRTLEAQWAAQSEKEAMFAPEAKGIDSAVDGVLAAIRDTTKSHVDASAPGDQVGKQGASLLEEIFPRGLLAVTSLPFVEELCEVERILSVLEHPSRAQAIIDLGLVRHVARLSSLAKQYRAALDVPAGKRVTFVEVKAARAEGQRQMLEVIARIVGRFPSDKLSDQAGRAAMLGPIVAQNEAIGQALRGRRGSLEDAEPETGAEAPQG